MISSREKIKAQRQYMTRFSQNMLSAAGESTQYVDQYLIRSNYAIERFLYAFPLYAVVAACYIWIYD